MGRILKAALTLALVLTAESAWGQAQPIVIKFTHVVAPDTPKGKAADRFAQLAAAKTGGAVRVEVYPNSQLYKDKEELEALQLGSVQMAAPSLAKFGPLGVREFEVFDLPYVFPDRTVLKRVVDGPIGASLMEKLKPQGIYGLAYWDNGFKQMTANRPLHTPEDFRGLKIRVQSSKVLEAQMRALGAIPQVMAFSEVYQAMQTGVVDGGENTPSNIYTQKFYEVQKDMTISDHGYIGYAVIVNLKYWSDLPANIRAQLEEAMAEATHYANEIAEQENIASLAAIKASGKTTIYYLTPEEKTKWRQALLPVHEQMESRVGKDLIEAIRKEAQAAGY